MCYNTDNSCVAFGLPHKNRTEYYRNYNATKRKEKKLRKDIATSEIPQARFIPKKADNRRNHKPSERDSDTYCIVHKTPLKRYVTNKNRFKGYDAHGNRLSKESVYFRCWHCHWEKKPSYVSEKINMLSALSVG
jgi:hypothetical protein